MPILTRLSALTALDSNAEQLANYDALAVLLTQYGDVIGDPEHAFFTVLQALALRLAARVTAPSDLRSLLQLSSPIMAVSVRELLRDAKHPLLSALETAGGQPSVSLSLLKLLVEVGQSQDNSNGTHLPFIVSSYKTDCKHTLSHRALQEFDMQPPFGYAACFVPTLAILNRSAGAASSTTAAAALSTAFGDRSWPPSSGGLSLVMWVRVERWGLDDHPVRLFTVFSPCNPEEELLAVTVGGDV
jgi:hypothetical protein